ncbi:GGDEF domain-containing protein [Enterobacter hormaechei]|uniref:GGDEF domain-containing protein n=1 Tax=Enterobacter hormaechei TaxID=158836 RepID=UPI0015FD76C5|nr:GGDEF domain-containing protein [Enterobacter hormaechei]MDS0249069.1 membrane-associated sensor domain-containing protein [Enterobacter hormaechei]QMV99133.1 membrane-associated sensor domain-containing protein [Enterobacter hormaechei]
MEKRHNATPEPATWPTRNAMVVHGLAMNLPWLAFVNASFALMILLLNSLFGQIDTLLHVSPPLTQMIDASMLGVVILSVALVIMAWRHIRGVSAVLLMCSLLWSISCYWFINVIQLPHPWPIFVTLLMAGMTALYFHPVGLVCFIAPLWITMPVASMLLNKEMNLRFAGLWVVFTFILVCGRYILLSWFEEAWRRNQQNQRLISRLDALAHQDPLTKTANRRAMELVLENAVEQGKRFTVLMLDVDYFKLYNDTYGHQAGDACLARVAEVLNSSVRTPEDVVSRYGGEEFVVILFDCEESVAEKVAARIQAGLRTAAIAHSASKVSECVTVSMGVAGYTPGLAGPEIIARADAALYRAKESGRDRWSR